MGGAGTTQRGIVPTGTPRFFHGLPGWRTRAHRQDQAGTFVEPFIAVDFQRPACARSSRREAVGYDTGCSYLVRRQVPQGKPDRCALSSPPTSPSQKYYLANPAQAKRDLQKKRVVRTPLDIYLRRRLAARSPTPASTSRTWRKLSRFMLESWQWLEKRSTSPDDRPGYLPR